MLYYCIICSDVSSFLYPHKIERQSHYMVKYCSVCVFDTSIAVCWCAGHLPTSLPSLAGCHQLWAAISQLVRVYDVRGGCESPCPRRPFHPPVHPLLYSACPTPIEATG